MVRGDAAETRRRRLEEIARLIHSSLHSHGELPYSKTVAEISYKKGLRKERVIEYLGILEEIGQFVIDRERDKIKKASES